ncbi:response regulator [Prosthecobacter sp.]|uniref:response regulator n=1 Tax=Prosthecobacter sp. TaxID=1965333 RepID=UPI002489FF35|nr:response regulator [Prosthecobacter sp.]MDI1312142.1 response regulator [Prosthecobacter sp.]
MITSQFNALKSGTRFSKSSQLLPLVGLLTAIAFFIGTAAISTSNIQSLRSLTAKVSHTHEVITGLEDIFSTIKDAETGQRGFLLTGDERYLAPYDAAISHIEERFASINELTRGNPLHQELLPLIKKQIDLKLVELAESIVMRRRDGFEAALEIVKTDRGKLSMELLRKNLTSMQQEERSLRRQRLLESEEAFQMAVKSTIAAGVLGMVMALVVAWMLQRNEQARRQQQWLQSGQAQLAQKLIDEHKLERLGDNALRFLCEYLGAQVGAIYIEDAGSFRRCATYAVPAGGSMPATLAAGEGLLGQAVKDRRPFLVSDVPEGYFAIGSTLGTARPRHLVIAPAANDTAVTAALELGFFQPVSDATLELLSRVSGSIGTAVQAAKSRAMIEELLEETQRQSEEMQTQTEELRVSNEELEEQSRVLKLTQTHLEHQQAELEQNNLQLESQTRLLEMQKNNLIQAKLGLETQARIVEQASHYKSTFLANMSHELRTPLNSVLILAQLLAENRHGNLSEEQIKYARTIQGSGNDLLGLINDVLDLAKIEAGHMDIKPQQIVIRGLFEALRSQFEPVADKRGLSLKLVAMPGAPDDILTDPQRLDQILRNLLSNALKFTEKGTVTVEVAGGEGTVSFRVRDTGIGISPEQQLMVFEPFCQGDDTTSRKYGGTGLGLSISRELARLLGGEIQLSSEPGQGSTFTLVIPATLVASAPPAAAPAEPATPTQSVPTAAKPTASVVPDDRDQLTPALKRAILVVEDDHNFAQVLAEIAREQNFQCLVATTAQAAVELARQHLPAAVVLDIGLPDGSGLLVLEQLKNDAHTRHIPVHVVSGNDYSEKALAMGALKYWIKPITREKLIEAFQDLENHLTHRLRRVLVVEDDPVQLKSLCALLSSREVEAVGAVNAAACLEQLRSSTFDCVVLDLSLPGTSGFALLEEISVDESYPFPPVIIYTGRELNADEEQQLRRYSKAIIVKGVKSPERLLDEVALFLHQVVRDLPAEQQRMIEKARSREAALEGRRVLLAEDDVRNIFALTSMLEPMGIQITVARNGREALDALEARQDSDTPIDLVLMDIMMPEMDGLEAMRAIRKRPDWMKLPIIALTAKAMPSDQQQCLAAGASDYLAKPLNVEKLLSLIRVWMPR